MSMTDRDWLFIYWLFASISSEKKEPAVKKQTGYSGYLKPHVPLILELRQKGMDRHEVAEYLLDNNLVEVKTYYRGQNKLAMLKGLIYYIESRLRLVDPHAAYNVARRESYYVARREYILHLRHVEQLTHKAIGKRMGIGAQRVADVLYKENRRFFRTLRRARFTITYSQPSS